MRYVGELCSAYADICMVLDDTASRETDAYVDEMREDNTYEEEGGSRKGSEVAHLPIPIPIFRVPDTTPRKNHSGRSDYTDIIGSKAGFA